MALASAYGCPDGQKLEKADQSHLALTYCATALNCPLSVDFPAIDHKPRRWPRRNFRRCHPGPHLQGAQTHEEGHGVVQDLTLH